MFNSRIRINKAPDEGWHYVEGVVYAPGVVDAHGDAMTAKDIEVMAYDFLAKGYVDRIDVQHNMQESGAQVVESYIARDNDPDYDAGAWVMKVRVKEDSDLWQSIQAGELNGYSFGAYARKVPVTVTVDVARVAVGETEASTAEGVEAHTHEFYLEFDSEGKLLLGTTDRVAGHVHQISGLTATDMSVDHAHRFFVR